MKSVWAFLLCGAVVAAAESKPADVTVRASVDRTAVWVADRLTYTVQITCAPGIDVLDDDLSRDKLKLEGFDLVSMDTARDAAPGETTIRTFRYHLTTYKVDQRALKIGEMAARYYRMRPGQGLENGAPIGEVKVPGVVVAFRSMLPEDQDTYPLRDDKPDSRRRRLFALAQPVGIGLIVASIVPALFWFVALVGTRRPRKERRSIRQVREEERTSLDAVRALDLSGADNRREAYSTISTLVREHLRDVVGIPGPSLTPDEIVPALASRPTRVPAETVTALLNECDTARYAPPAALPSADACRSAIDSAAQVLAAR